MAFSGEQRATAPEPRREPILSEASAPPRFRWPMRLLLFLLIGDMLVRGFGVLLPLPAWREELGMERQPRRLPTRAEVRELLARDAIPYSESLTEEVLRSLDSVWNFCKPWPGRDVRERIAEADSWKRGGTFVLCWLNTRLEFLENLAGIDQEWPMFSPSVSQWRWIARARLEFADGTTQTIRQTADPADLTRFTHWNQEKVLDYELHVRDDDEIATSGWCNLLAHRHARNEQGAALARIVVFLVRYDYPPPGTDARAFLHAQTGPPADQVRPPYYEYDARTRQGKMLPRQP